MFAIPQISSLLSRSLGLFATSPRTANLLSANKRFSESSAQGSLRNGGDGERPRDLDCMLVLPRVHASVFDGTQDISGDASVVVYNYDQLHRKTYSVNGVLVFAGSAESAVRLVFPAIYGEIQPEVRELPEFDRFAWQGLEPNDSMRFSLGHQVQCPVCDIGLAQIGKGSPSGIPSELLADGQITVASRTCADGSSVTQAVAGASHTVCCVPCAESRQQLTLESRTNVNAMLNRLSTIQRAKAALDDNMDAAGAAIKDRWMIVGGRAFQVNAVRILADRAPEYVIWDQGHQAALVSSQVMRQLIVAGKLVNQSLAQASSIVKVRYV